MDRWDAQLGRSHCAQWRDASVDATSRGELETTLTSWQPFFAKWPAFATQADANQRASLHLWAIDRLLRALNEAEAETAAHSGAECVEYPLTKVWPAVFGTGDEDEPALRSTRTR